ncbi:ABC transporter ATP-binding protein [Neomicrococcus aestuarii]|uniref:ABC transporter ATP-binding protein n=1 Tax=Neomicrococcus aestuarii TaxID=556325 RepID=UPI0009FEA68C|nr:ABC transporter ATP-binding protein [Neomicrococcus aestuarii]
MTTFVSNVSTPASASTSAPGTAQLADSAFAVHFEGVGRSFDSANGTTKVVLRDIDLSVAPHEIVAILGPSGSGKSTLLRAASGLDQPNEGRILIDGVAVKGIDPRCAVAFQEPRLLPWQNLAKNVELGLPAGTSKTEGAERIKNLLQLVGLSESAHLRPREISGGMAQRTSLARALARRPGVLLLDEPFGALDALTRLKMQDLLLAVHEAHPTTVLLVTHDVDEALQLADRIVVLGREDNKPGATISHVLTVPGARPRDRADAELARMRAELLSSLGVDAHRH